MLKCTAWVFNYKACVFIFLDESGDLGFNFENKKPSTHFCITLLVCKEATTLTALRSVVKNALVRKLNHNKTKNFIAELKGTNTTLEVKKYFYKQLTNFVTPVIYDIEIYTIIFDKRDILNPITPEQNNHKIYNFVAKEILDSVDFSAVTDQVNLYVDRCKGYQERSLFDAYIRSHLEVKLPFNIPFDIQHKQSQDLPGLQTVDLFCYGIVRKYAANDMSWYSVFSNQIKKEIFWKPKF